MTANVFKFELGDEVYFSSGEAAGKVIARTEYQFGEPEYLVFYVSPSGEASKSWYPEKLIEAMPY
jgi:hypothetical protein